VANYELRPADEISLANGLRITIRPHLWIWWAEIAIGQERLAREARHLETGANVSEQLRDETRASLIAIAASAHALDGLYGVARDFFPRLDTGRRWSTVLETFKAAFYVRGSAGGGAWAREFEWLFDQRDAALHHTEETREPVPHPSGLTSVGWANVAFSLEPAERAVDLMLEVVETAVTSPRPPLEEWAIAFRPTFQRLKERPRLATSAQSPEAGDDS